MLLVWRALEFGISQYVGFQYQMKIYTPSADEEMTEIFRSVQVVILLSAVIPLFLAGLLWWLAPRLAQFVVAERSLDIEPAQLSVSSLTLMQVAGFVFIALALTNLPQIIYSFWAESIQDPTLTIMTSRVFPDALQFFGKIVVGCIILIIVKEQTKRIG